MPKSAPARAARGRICGAGGSAIGRRHAADHRACIASFGQERQRDPGRVLGPTATCGFADTPVLDTRHRQNLDEAQATPHKRAANAIRVSASFLCCQIACLVAGNPRAQPTDGADAVELAPDPTLSRGHVLGPAELRWAPPWKSCKPPLGLVRGARRARHPARRDRARAWIVHATITTVYIIAIFMIIAGGSEIMVGHQQPRTWGHFFLWIRGRPLLHRRRRLRVGPARSTPRSS